MSAPKLPGAPLLGSLLDVRRDMLGLFERASQLGDVVRIEFPGRVGYLVVHPDNIKQILVDDHKKFGKQTRGYQMLRIALGQGLVTSEGDFWRRQRRIAQPAFHHQRIQKFGQVMSESTDAMLDQWSRTYADGDTLDVHGEMMAVTLRIVGLVLMGVDLTDETDRVGQAITTVLEETVHRIVHPLSPPLWVPTARNQRFTKAIAQMHTMVGELIEHRRTHETEHRDLLAMLMEATDEETGERMTDEQLRDEVMTMVSAGHETTANALSWAFHLLADAPEATAKVQEEVDRVLGGGPAGIEHLGQLSYTEAVIKEAMRLRPPVWMLARSVQTKTTIAEQPVEPPNMIFLAPWVTHRDPRFWKDPRSFRPERFLTGELEGQPKYAYFPFAGGPRVCIGNSFAIMEAKLLLAMILQRFELRAVEGFEVVPEPTITLRPKYGLQMSIRARNPG